MKRLALVSTLICVSAFSEELSVDKFIKGVENRYNRTQTLQVLFTEAYTGPGRPRRTESGTLFLRKPGRMRWDYSSPVGKLFLSDGKDLYLYTPGTNRVEKMKMKESEDMRAPLAFLLGKLNFRRDFQNFSLRQEGTDIWFSAEPKSDNVPYTRVEFIVTPDYRIRHMQLTGYDRSVLEFAFDQEKINPSLNSKFFEFRMPPGAYLAETAQ